MTESSITKAEYETLAAFRYALRQFLRFSEQAAHDAGLAPQQHQALLAVMGYPGTDRVTVGELAERLQIRHHSAVGLVDRLEAEGLVERQPAREDRRQVFVCLTDRGLELLAQLSAAHRRELQRLGPEFKALLDRLEGSAASSTGGQNR